MKLLKQRFEHDGSGDVLLIPEETEDMWHCYNLILVGDHVKVAIVLR